jgi:hypothetical protein
VKKERQLQISRNSSSEEA